MNSIIQVIFVIPDFVRRWEKYLFCAVGCHVISQWLIYRHHPVAFFIVHCMSKYYDHWFLGCDVV
jgi:hypothetical protein